MPFDHPLWVVYSSGTTGCPSRSCTVTAGSCSSTSRRSSFHQDLRPGDVFAWYTTTGWMMWNYLAGGLLAGADHRAVRRQRHLAGHRPAVAAGRRARRHLPGGRRALSGRLHEGRAAPGGRGRPVRAAGHRLDRVAAAARGVRLGVRPGRAGPAARLVLGRHRPVHRASSGPARCCRSGPESSPAAVWARRWRPTTTTGQPVIGQVGELVITQPMPSMPVGFWHDPGGVRYRESYFDIYPGVWRHGDWIELLPDGGCVIYGRSDATLNRGGVRMGTSEFYRVVEGFGEIADSLVVDTGRLGAEGRLILFVVPAAGRELDDDLAGRLRAALRSQLSPGTCRTRSTRCRVSRGPCPGRSWRCRCARSCSAPSRSGPPTRTRWPTPKSSPISGTAGSRYRDVSVSNSVTERWVPGPVQHRGPHTKEWTVDRCRTTTSTRPGKPC